MTKQADKTCYMNIFLTLETASHPKDFVIFNAMRRFENNVENLSSLKRVEMPALADGLYVIMRIFPKEDLNLPRFETQVVRYSKKAGRFFVSCQIEMEMFFALPLNDQNNLLLDKLIEATSFLQVKKVDVDLDFLKNELEAIRV